MKVLAVIPARDEAESLPSVVEELQRTVPGLEILVVDDASEDRTPQVIRGLRVRSLRLGRHLGVGGAVRAGLRYAQDCGIDFVVRLDADGQHGPAGIVPLLEPVVRGEFDATVGSRYLGTVSYQVGGLRRATHRTLAALLTRATGRPVTDPTSGFWAFGPGAIRLLSAAHPDGYSEVELPVLLSRSRLRWKEVPIDMRPRVAGRPKFTSLDALRVLGRCAWTIVPSAAAPAIDRPGAGLRAG